MALRIVSDSRWLDSRTRRRRLSAAALVIGFTILLNLGCSRDGIDSERISWEACGDNLECGSLAVPLDYGNPAGAVINLALVRMPATDPAVKIGSLVVNPGGPGASGVDFLTQAGTYYFPSSLRERFDLVSFDPRGVGGSSPVNCLNDLDAFYAIDLTPDDDAEWDAMLEKAHLMADACRDANGDLLRHVGTMDVVRDLERIRHALGGDPLNYVGFSYGTKIGALYAEHYPEHVRAMVLDGVLPPSMEPEQLMMAQSAGFESAMGAFLSWCAASNDCEFGDGDPRSAFTSLMTELDRQPLTAEGRTLGPGEASFGVIMGLYGRDWWPDLAHALATAAGGDSGPLLAMSDGYVGRREDGSYDDSLEAQLAVMCIDAPWPSLDGFRTLAQQADEQFPYFGAFPINSSLPCALWPAEPVSRPEIVRGAGAPPIMLIGTTNDPATPYQWAASLAGEMETAVLVTLEGEGHVAMGRENPCIDETVDNYLIDLILPGGNRRCDETLAVAAGVRAKPSWIFHHWRRR